jgi:hypothetical protein
LGLALCLPGPAFAADATIASRDVPLAGQRALAAADVPDRFNLVGHHWRGPGTVEFRTRSLDGRWRPWADAAPEPEDQPNSGSAERARTSAWRVGNPWWVGASNRIEYRLQGRVSRLRTFFVWSPPAAVPGRSLQKAGSPPITPRSGWSADESIRRNMPVYAPDLRLALVHHTAGSNGYTRAEAPAIVKAIQLYHVKGNGWNDIGYNFLVDRFGQVFEGRFGGIVRNVVGAHAAGFNTGSVGVSVLGEYSSLSVSPQARDALERLLAWRLDVAHLDPATTLTYLSGGNARFRAGIPVFLRAVSGHRDTGFTDCPGSRLYGVLNAIAGNVSRIGLPKLYSPSVTGTVPGLVRFRARLSAALPWTIDVRDAAGSYVASTAGFGSTIDWTWDASLTLAGSYSYSIRAGADALPATGAVGAAPLQVAIAHVAAEPPTVTPNGDGVADATTITYTLPVPAVVTAVVRDASGEGVATHAQGWKRAAEHQLRLDPSLLPDGVYDVELTAQATGGRTASVSVRLAVTRTLGQVSASRASFSPNGDRRADEIAFRFGLTSPATVRLRILREGTWIATLLDGAVEPGPQTVAWDGRKRFGRLLDGSYQAVLEVTDAIATATVALPFVSDTRRPQLRVTQRFPLRVLVSEPARLAVRIGSRSLVHEARTAGVARIPNAPRRGRVRVVAWDPAGNVSLPAIRR